MIATLLTAAAFACLTASVVCWLMAGAHPTDDRLGRAWLAASLELAAASIPFGFLAGITST